MASNYHYILASLPDLDFDESTDYRSYLPLFDEVMGDLSANEQYYLKFIRFQTDNANLISITEGEEGKFLEGGNYSLPELSYEIRALDSIPSYMQAFLEFRKSMPVAATRHGRVDLLISLFYREALSLGNVFLKNWFSFERDFENVLTAIECNRHDEPIERREIPRIGQRPGQRLIGDYEVTYNILHSKSLDYSLSGQHPWVSRILELDPSSPVDYEKSLMELRLEKLGELFNQHEMEFENILAFFIRLQLYSRWSRLTEEKGRGFYEGILARTEKFVKDSVLNG